ncbi:MAG: cell division protein ZapA [Spirochaetota bacterium]|nr:cell division protein ZapA [Spirochaetota bacterium]
MENKMKVSIYGSTYNIQGDALPDYILQLADYVDGRMRDVSKNVSSGNLAQIAILAALNIADEFFQLQEMRSDITHELERKTKTLISMLDEGLIGDVFSNINAVPV